MADSLDPAIGFQDHELFELRVYVEIDDDRKNQGNDLKNRIVGKPFFKIIENVRKFHRILLNFASPWTRSLQS